MNTNTAAEFAKIHATLNADDRNLVAYADFMVRQGNEVAEVIRSLKGSVVFMDDIDAGYAMLGLFA